MLSGLKNYVDCVGHWQLSQQYDDLCTTYQTMLRYYVKGVEDPDSERMLASIAKQIIALSDRVKRRKLMIQFAPGKYATTYRAVDGNPSAELPNVMMALETHCTAISSMESNPNDRESIQEHDMDEAVRLHEETTLMLFNSVWTSDAWSKADYETANDLLASQQIFVSDKAVLVSAATLALQTMYDERKLMFLFDAYLSAEAEVNQRAIVGIVLTMRQYDDRMPLYSEVMSRLSLYSEEHGFVRDFYRALTCLQYSKITDTISDKMRNDIIPSILNSNAANGLKNGMMRIDEELTKHGENPEWHRSPLDDEKASRKIREMADLQMEGADVYMGTFTMAKGYPFFRTVAHWLYPFTMYLPEMKQTRKLFSSPASASLQALFSARTFCNSDAYSFCFMIESIGGSMIDMVNAQVEDQLDGEERNELLRKAMSSGPKPADICRHYIQDLYRFYRIYPYHYEFGDPFAKDKPAFTPLITQAFRPMLQGHREELLMLADFMMRKEFYREALDLFAVAAPQLDEQDADLWQKMGFCHQKLSDPHRAYESYLTANQLRPDSKWTLTHLAHTAFELEYYESAFDYYTQLLSYDEDNVKYLFRTAECKLHQEQYSEAIPILYKVDYLEEHSVKVRMALALCLLMTGAIDKAISTYQSVLEDKPAMMGALIGLGHAYMVAGQSEEAFRNYVMARASAGEEDFRESLFSLAPQLEALGVARHKLTLMYEATILL